MAKTPRENCKHTELQFGSGDYYIFCHACGAWWACVDPSSNEYRPAPELANKGDGSQLSGQMRREPSHLTAHDVILKETGEQITVVVRATNE